MHLKYQVIGTDVADASVMVMRAAPLWASRCPFRGPSRNPADPLWGCAHVCVCVCVRVRVRACVLCQLSRVSLCLSPGSMIERILVSCSNQQDLHEWVDHLQKQTKVTSAGNPTIKPHSVPSHTVRAPAPLPPQPGSASRVQWPASGRALSGSVGI